jgi:hypothetical protein
MTVVFVAFPEGMDFLFMREAITADFLDHEPANEEWGCDIA